MKITKSLKAILAASSVSLLMAAPVLAGGAGGNANSLKVVPVGGGTNNTTETNEFRNESNANASSNPSGHVTNSGVTVNTVSTVTSKFGGGLNGFAGCRGLSINGGVLGNTYGGADATGFLNISADLQNGNCKKAEKLLLTNLKTQICRDLNLQANAYEKDGYEVDWHAMLSNTVSGYAGLGGRLTCARVARKKQVIYRPAPAPRPVQPPASTIYSTPAPLPPAPPVRALCNRPGVGCAGSELYNGIQDLHDNGPVNYQDQSNANRDGVNYYNPAIGNFRFPE